MHKACGQPIKNGRAASLFSTSLFSKLVVYSASLIILVPALLMLIWAFTGRWPWPNLVPESFSLRSFKELLFGSTDILSLLISSISLALISAGISTLIAVLSARGIELYLTKAKTKAFFRFCGTLPLLIPGTVFAIGIHLVFLRIGLADTLMGVVFVHVIVSLPYALALMSDVVASLGGRLEEQAALLGARPLSAFCYASLPQMLGAILSSFSLCFILSYSQYFTTLIVGGGQVKTLALVLIPYIQSGDRALASAYALVFAGSALVVFALCEWAAHRLKRKDGRSGSKD